MLSFYEVLDLEKIRCLIYSEPAAKCLKTKYTVWFMPNIPIYFFINCPVITIIVSVFNPVHIQPFNSIHIPYKLNLYTTLKNLISYFFQNTVINDSKLYILYGRCNIYLIFL